MNPSTIQIVGAVLFGIAVLHTFLTKYFEHLAHVYPNHAGVFHLLGEVEVVFGFWAMVLILFFMATLGQSQAIAYLESRNFTEPTFVFVIMVMAATKPITDLVSKVVVAVARSMPLDFGPALFFIMLGFVPLLGSFITEPAAMTIAALMLRDIIFSKSTSSKLRYATLGVLFVNISIGGTLTTFAAPPVLMVAAKWNWDMMYMLTHIGWKAACAVLINAGVVTYVYRKELAGVEFVKPANQETAPWSVSLVHVVFLSLVVVFAHHPVVFMGLFLFFLGFTAAYQKYQRALLLREALLVGFFLAGLVILGGLQQWWLEPALLSMDSTSVYYGATALTAITDNAALTYLGSLVNGLSEEFKLSLVAGAVTGGGLTVIANAPNPAGAAILKTKFSEQTINPLYLLYAALPPTVVAIMAFRLL
jgi:hypothetical protein